MTGTPPASRPRLPAPTGLARAALRSQPASFVGTLVALAMASMIISACGFLAETGVRAHPTPHRYASAPVVVTADQRAHLVTGSGEDRTDAAERVPERARLDVARLSRRAEAVPAVARVVPDVRLTVSARHGDTPFAGAGLGLRPAHRHHPGARHSAPLRARTGPGLRRSRRPRRPARRHRHPHHPGRRPRLPPDRDHRLRAPVRHPRLPGSPTPAPGSWPATRNGPTRSSSAPGPGRARSPRPR
ncbi:hypothetical protein HLB32_32225, partial [Streptomyces cacaoi]|nr:hypothetical protein [Streptomyces cacaoi]